LSVVSVQADPLIQFRAVRKAFGAHVVLDGFDLAVAEGERIALIGPSGSGKTTVLRLLMGLDAFDGGEIEVGGVPLSRPTAQARAARRQIGMVFQHFNLFPHLTVMGNVTEAPRRVLGLNDAQARARAAELLAMVGLEAKHESLPRQLSGGQQQRVAIARALAMRPRIMLFDEITSALDPELVGEVLRVVRQLARDSGMTMLIVTHEMSFARDVSDGVVFMEHGLVAEYGPPDVIFRAPHNERTRAFLQAILER
jgi:polar amino acid transport system ATP-binding protein